MSFQSFEALIEQNFWLFLLIMIWSIVWKGLALWRSSHKEQKLWFAAILVIKTVGILEILYLFVFSKPDDEDKKLR